MISASAGRKVRKFSLLKFNGSVNVTQMRTHTSAMAQNGIYIKD